MKSKPISLEKFITEYQFFGTWEVSYTDQTHLPENMYVKLGKITIDDDDELIAQNSLVLPFTFRPVTKEDIKSHFSQILSKAEESVEQAKKSKKGEKEVEKQLKEAEKHLKEAKNRVKYTVETIRDQLAESMVRTGLLRPVFRLMQDRDIQIDFREILNNLRKNPYLVLVVDTGAIRRGAVSFLQKTLSQKTVWTVIPVFVMIEVQRKVKWLSEIWKNRHQENIEEHILKRVDVLENRPQVSCISRELNYTKHLSPVEMLTTLPEIWGKVENDRLIIESVKNLERERGIHQGVYLLTSDKDMASLAVLENVNTLYVGIPSLPNDGVVSSVRYDSYNQKFLLSSIHYLLWDLTQVFSTIQIKNSETGQTYNLMYYCDARDGFFAHDILEIKEC
jgi:hypothetical protein